MAALSVIGFLAIKVKKIAENRKEAQVLPQNVIMPEADNNNNDNDNGRNVVQFNQPLISTGKVTLMVIFLAALVFSVRLSKMIDMKESWIKYSEIFFLWSGQVITILFYLSNKDLRKHVKSLVVSYYT